MSLVISGLLFVSINWQIPPAVAQESINLAYVETIPNLSIATQSVTLPTYLTLVRPAFVISATAAPVTLTLHTAQFPPNAKLAYQAPATTTWQRLPLQINPRQHTWHIISAPIGQYAVVTINNVNSVLPRNAIIVDDLDIGFTIGGPTTTWHLVTGPDPTDYYLGHARWTSNTYDTVENWGVWKPTPPISGVYEVYTFIPGNHASTTNAVYRIVDAVTDTWRPVNQSIHWANWVSLGVYTFTGDTEEYVSLTDVTYEAYAAGNTWGSYMVAFDAVAFVPQTTYIYLPLLMRNWPPPPQLNDYRLKAGRFQNLVTESDCTG